MYIRFITHYKVRYYSSWFPLGHFQTIQRSLSRDILENNSTKDAGARVCAFFYRSFLRLNLVRLCLVTDAITQRSRKRLKWLTVENWEP